MGIWGSRNAGANRTRRAKLASHLGWRKNLRAEPLEDRRLMAAGGDEQLTGLIGNEPAVAVDPNNPDVVAVAQFRTVSISRDGGLTFPIQTTVQPPGTYTLNRGGDPSLAFDANGQLYFSYLGSNANPAVAGLTLAVFSAVINPTNGAILQNQLVAAEGNTFENDKEWVAVDAWNDSPFRNNAYIIWTQLGGGSVVQFSRSTNGGANWSAAQAINGAGQGFVWPAEVAVNFNGDVWAGWHTNTANNAGNLGSVRLRKSSDGGVTFQPETIPFPAGTADITDNAPPNVVLPGLQSWLQGSVQPRIVLDPARPNNIYVICVDDPDNNYAVGDGSDIVMARSTDYGQTWTRTTISHAPFGTLQFMPTAYVDEEGNLAVTWYDTRRGLPSVGPDQVPGNGDDNLLLDVYATVSRDGGLTFSQDFRVNENPFDPDRGPPTDRFPPNQVFRIGEYNGHGADTDLAFVAWAANSGNNQDIAFDVFSMNSAFSDAYEANNTQATASNLGSPSSLTIDNLSIDPGDTNPDEDFFRWRAPQSGTLDVAIRFTHRAGDLDLEIRDVNGNIILARDNITASSLSVDDDEQLVIPVVAGQDYFVHVFGAGGNTNSYTLELQNDAAPPPLAVLLNPADDTGMSNTDNIINLQTPTVFITADLSNFAAQNIDILDPAEVAANDAGAAVEVFSGGVSRGFATAVPGSNNTLFTFQFTAGQLAEGTNVIQSAVRMFDGRRTVALARNPASGRTQLSNPLLLTLDTTVPPLPAGAVPDLLASSDTGMFPDDNITNIQQPAFQGVGAAGAMVRVRANGLLVGSSTVGSDATDGILGNGLGAWEITVEPLTDTTYAITAEYEDKAGNIVSTTSLGTPPPFVVIDTLAPNQPYLDLLATSDSGRNNVDDITNDNTPTLSSTTFERVLAGDPPSAHLIKYRIYDRRQNGPETLVVDSFVTLAGMVAHGQFNDTLAALTDGVHNLKLEVEDRAGNISPAFLLSLTIDTVAPPLPTLALDPSLTDTGIPGQDFTYIDRITKNNAPGFVGYAESDAIIRLFADATPISEFLNNASDRNVGLTVAVPLDGNGAQGNLSGQYRISPDTNLNNPIFFAQYDGRRQIGVTAEDVAGNISGLGNGAIASNFLDIFLDTQGPQVEHVGIGDAPGFDLFAQKPALIGPTPLVYNLDVDFVDLPNRVGGALPFVYFGVNFQQALNTGNYELVGDHTGAVAIVNATLTDFSVDGQPGRTTVRLSFASPLADDRYTLRVKDRIGDDAGNALDGETNAVGPLNPALTPSGDGNPGGDFVARFTVDSRPEVANYSEGSVYVDINGNYVFDPQGQNNDTTNRDLVFSLGFATDAIFAGNFAHDGFVIANGFDKLGAYGKVGNDWRWLIDQDGDGVVDLNVVQPVILGFDQTALNGLPVAGEFDGNPFNGDEVGLFNGSYWVLDSNHNHILDNLDTTFGGIGYSMVGFPIAGDFDGDGFDDVGTYDAALNRFQFDLRNNGFGLSADRVIDFSANGNQFNANGRIERPIAADMDQDGIDDIGLWIPGRQGQIPRDAADWYLLLSNDFIVPGGAAPKRVTGQVNTLDHPFSPDPLGSDWYAQFGDEFSLPLVGNFDPPVSGAGASGPSGNNGVGFWNPTTSTWFVKYQQNQGLSNELFNYGPANQNLQWLPIFGDWDGQLDDSIGLFDRDTATWFLKNTRSQGLSDVVFQYGPVNDNFLPIFGDWNGDGIDTPGFYDTSTSTWFLKNSFGQGLSDIVFQYGPANSGWFPLFADWNNDGFDTPGFYDFATATWFLKNTFGQGVSDVTFQYGPAGVQWWPLPGDWNGDGFDTPGFYDPITATWFLKNTFGQGTSDVVFNYGPTGDPGWIPLVGDWDLGMLAATSAGPGAAPLVADLTPIVDEAVARWAAAGLSAQQQETLRNTQVRFANLTGDQLGIAFDRAILIDDDAAGWGWFNDPTPARDEEFGGGSATSAAARSHLDLLTAVMHEMGHLLGLDHDNDTGLMNDRLSPGQRRVPTASLVDRVLGD